MKVGDRIILPTNGGTGSNVYPYQGTKFACGGEILGIFISSYSRYKLAHIIWDNGVVSNIYLHRLEYENNELNQTDPNSAFLLEKRRRR